MSLAVPVMLLTNIPSVCVAIGCVFTGYLRGSHSLNAQNGVSGAQSEENVRFLSIQGKPLRADIICFFTVFSSETDDIKKGI